MLNYFNYFTEIETYFQTKRDVFTLLTTLDWVLIEGWKDRGVPLEAVLKGIDRAFAKPDAKRRIGSLAYCVKPIEQVLEEQKDMRVEKPDLPEVATNEVAEYVEKLAMSVSGLRSVFPEFAGKFDGIAETIRRLNVTNLREAEQELSALEERLLALLKVACDEAVLVEVRREIDGELGPFRSKMTADQLTMLEQQMWRRKLMERFNVPRLSLFYLI